MTESDARRLADFDIRVAGWSFLDNEAGWPRIHHDAMFLRRLLRESEAERERRQTELLEANNREVERRRTAVAALRGILAHDFAEECQECGIGRSEAWLAAKAILDVVAEAEITEIT